MGVRNLREIAVTSSVRLSNFSGQTAAVDAQNWISLYSSGVRSSTAKDVYTLPNGESIDYLLGTLRGIRKLFTNNIRPIFAFDSDIMFDIKERNQKPTSDRPAPYLTDSYKENMGSLLSHLDIPNFQGGWDGEAEAAMLVREGPADFVLSEDFDSLLYGAPKTIRNFSGNDKEELVSLQKTLTEHNLTRRELVNIALAIGTDFNTGIKTIGAKKALQAIQDGSSLEKLARENGYILPENIDTYRSAFLNPDTSTPTGDPGYPNPNFEELRDFLHSFEIPEDIIESELKYTERSFRE